MQGSLVSTQFIAGKELDIIPTRKMPRAQRGDKKKTGTQIKLNTFCYGLNCVRPISCVEILTPSTSERELV